MVGLPRSGKSTVSRDIGCPIVCPDAIRLALHGLPSLSTMEPYVWAIARTMVEALFYAGHDKVILDATNITRFVRNQWKSDKWVRYFVEVPTLPEVCKERARLTNQEYLLDVIDSMHKKFEPLTYEEKHEADVLLNHDDYIDSLDK